MFSSHKKKTAAEKRPNLLWNILGSISETIEELCLVILVTYQKSDHW